jgi:methanogenic corrinoid protein MtbC1
VDDFEQEAGPQTAIARNYLSALLRAERQQATNIVMSAVGHGINVKDIYLHVFEPVQHEIGRLWQTNQINVAQEHFCSAATQHIMSQLYPYIFGHDRNGRRVVIACVSGELHEIGARMVADFFELDGWDTYYVGANTPVRSILETIGRRQADILAVSATINFNVGAVADLISAVRTSPDASSVKVLVGGRPFTLAPHLWQKVGADGYAPGAGEAVSMAAQILPVSLKCS